MPKAKREAAVVQALELLQWVGTQAQLRIETWRRPGAGDEVSVWAGLDAFYESQPTATGPNTLAALQAAMLTDKAR